MVSDFSRQGQNRKNGIAHGNWRRCLKPWCKLKRSEDLQPTTEKVRESNHWWILKDALIQAWWVDTVGVWEIGVKLTDAMTEIDTVSPVGRRAVLLSLWPASNLVLQSAFNFVFWHPSSDFREHQNVTFEEVLPNGDYSLTGQKFTRFYVRSERKRYFTGKLAFIPSQCL
jgi:hypothetical protein